MTTISTIISLSAEDSSFLSTTIHPEIELDERHDYSCSLLDFSILSPTPAQAYIIINESNQKFFYNYQNNNTSGWIHSTISIVPGEYTFMAIAKSIEDHLRPRGFIIKFVFDEHNMKYRFENPEADLEINIEPDNTILRVFGFGKRRLHGSKLYWAEQNIYPYTNIQQPIRVNCDLVDTSSSFHNGASSHTLHEFLPNAAVNYKMIERPHNHIYLPIGRQRIGSVNIKVTDQNDRPISLLKSERIICRIGIRKTKRRRPRRNVDLSGLA